MKEGFCEAWHHGFVSLQSESSCMFYLTAYGLTVMSWLWWFDSKRSFWTQIHEESCSLWYYTPLHRNLSPSLEHRLQECRIDWIVIAVGIQHQSKGIRKLLHAYRSAVKEGSTSTDKLWGWETLLNRGNTLIFVESKEYKRHQEPNSKFTTAFKKDRDKHERGR